VLLGGQPRHRLEPVREVRGAALDGPFLHRRLRRGPRGPDRVPDRARCRTRGPGRPTRAAARASAADRRHSSRTGLRGSPARRPGEGAASGRWTGSRRDGSGRTWAWSPVRVDDWVRLQPSEARAADRSGPFPPRHGPAAASAGSGDPSRSQRSSAWSRPGLTDALVGRVTRAIRFARHGSAARLDAGSARRGTRHSVIFLSAWSCAPGVVAQPGAARTEGGTVCDTPHDRAP
jgi:hypothetical protein